METSVQNTGSRVGGRNGIDVSRSACSFPLEGRPTPQESAEVASIGGFVQEYQIDVDPDAMRAAKVSLADVFQSVRMTNVDVGARTIELNKAEYVIRGLGFIVAEPAFKLGNHHYVCVRVNQVDKMIERVTTVPWNCDRLDGNVG